MYCTKCGKEVFGNFCTACGCKVHQTQVAVSANLQSICGSEQLLFSTKEEVRKKTLGAFWGLILFIVSFALIISLVSYILGMILLAIILLATPKNDSRVSSYIEVYSNHIEGVSVEKKRFTLTYNEIKNIETTIDCQLILYCDYCIYCIATAKSIAAKNVIMQMKEQLSKGQMEAIE